LLLLLFFTIPIFLLGFFSVEFWYADILIRSQVYVTQLLLTPASFFLLRLGDYWGQGKRRHFLAWGIIFINVINITAQVFFANRLPFIRGIFFALVWMLIFPAYYKARISFRKVIILVVFMIGISFSIVAFEPPVWNHLANRFKSYTPVVLSVVNGEDVSTVFYQYPDETKRLQEVITIFKLMDTSEILIGTGLGGYKIDTSFQNWLLEISGYLVPARTNVHMGIFWAFFKGGIMFWLILYSGVLALVFSYKHFQSNTLNLACWAFVMGLLFFSVFEGLWMQPGIETTTFLVGACLGRCASERSDQISTSMLISQ
jgi:hypothetical protein